MPSRGVLPNGTYMSVMRMGGLLVYGTEEAEDG